MKARVSKVVLKRLFDSEPDLSYLGRFSSSPDTESKDEYAIDRKEEERYLDNREYRYFIAANVENKTQALENYYRTMQYSNGNLCDFGIRAEAEILIPDGGFTTKGKTYTIQTISSGGIWGIQSDSDKSYFKEMEDQELAQLKTQLKALGLRIPKNMDIERSGPE